MKYAFHENFHKWVRWYWTLQYLPDDKEHSVLLETNLVQVKDVSEVVREGKVKLAEYVSILVPMRRDRVWRLRWNDWKEDMQSRLRDMFSK